MSRSLSVATVIEKNRLSSDVAFVVLADIEFVDPATGVVAETAHFARNSEDVVFNGITYVAGHFDIEFRQEQGTQPTVNIVVRDLSRGLQAKMQQYGGGVGFNVTIIVANTAQLDKPAEVVENFQVTGASANNYIVTFQLGVENAVMQTFPRRRQTKDFCQWRYKDPDTCGYSGGLTTCDLTLQGPNGCAAHSNTPNFGAFPGINSNGAVYA